MKILQSIRSIIDDRTFLIFTSLHVEDMLQQRHWEGQDEEFGWQVLKLPGHVDPVMKECLCFKCWDMRLQNIVMGSRTFHHIHLFKECTWYTKCFYHFYNNKKFSENFSWADSHKTLHIKNEFSIQGIIHSRTTKNSTFGRWVGDL